MGAILQSTDIIMTARPEISVIAPCHNERENLRPLVEAVRGALNPLGSTYEIVLVDDGSRDQSWPVLQELGRADQRVRSLRFAVNCGQSAALWAGIQAARGQILVTLDADLQNPPSEIPRLLEALKDADCVCGSRVAARVQGDHWLRRASSQIANSIRNKVSGETISDAGCCFRAFRRECVAHVKFFRGAHRFLPTLIKLDGYRVSEIPVRHNLRRMGRSHYGIWNRVFKTSADLLAVRWMKTRTLRYRVGETIN
ncbi:MAG TPA: glycosyltransferase family 2 protein [Verrucomicrobiae bacterium]|nr:glycosyltransferase family 2 protein [Verrucomicrobiae bacterium]